MTAGRVWPVETNRDIELPSTNVAPHEPGRVTVEYLLGQGRLEKLTVHDLDGASMGLVERAALRLETARAGLVGGDLEGAFVVGYDVYRICADSLLVRQGLRATGGQGSHAAVEDAVSAQFGALVPGFAKPTFERLRRTRNALQYFDPGAPEISVADAEWAIETADHVLTSVRKMFSDGEPDLFESG